MYTKSSLNPLLKKNTDLLLSDPNLINIINNGPSQISSRSSNSATLGNSLDSSMSRSRSRSRSSENLYKSINNLVPLNYRIKVPQLVWESKKITWHGHAFYVVQRAFKEALCDNLTETAIIHMTELVASGYSSELWDSLWETFFMQGLIFSKPSLASFFLNEYKFLNSLKSKLVKHHNLEDLVNNQVYRNHVAELLTIFSISEHRSFSNEFLTAVNAGCAAVDLIMEPIKDGVSRSLSQEYILMSKTDENTCVQLEELHYNLSKFFEATRMATESKKSNIANENVVINESNVHYEQTFFWIHEIVKMTEMELKATLQNYLPRQEEEWTRHPSNILWNYLFIRAPNKIWGLLAILMEIFTINFKRKQTLTCSAILQNVLIMIHDEEFLCNIRPNSTNYVRSREPIVIQTVLKINELMLLAYS